MVPAALGQPALLTILGRWTDSSGFWPRAARRGI